MRRDAIAGVVAEQIEVIIMDKAIFKSTYTDQGCRYINRRPVRQTEREGGGGGAQVGRAGVGAQCASRLKRNHRGVAVSHFRFQVAMSQ